VTEIGQIYATLGYIYGPNHIDEPLMMLGETGAFWMHQDANWNVIALSNAAGELAESEFVAAVERHQRDVIAASRQRAPVAGRG